MPEYLYPGVYIDDTQSQPQRIKGVPTSTAGGTRALAVGAFAVGAFALAFSAIGALVIYRMRIKDLGVRTVHFDRLSVDELTVGRLHIVESVKGGCPRKS